MPVLAPTGTVAVICVPEFTVNPGAFTPPNVTFVAPVKPVPVIVITAPTRPLVGLKLVTVGVTRNARLLVSVAVGVVTVMNPVAAVAGTVAVRYVSETTEKVALIPLNDTLLVPVNPWPRISTVLPEAPCHVTSPANGCRPMSRL